MLERLFPRPYRLARRDPAAPLRGWPKLAAEVAAHRLLVEPPPSAPVAEGELAALPEAARAFMRFQGVRPGQPKRWALRAGWRGRFRMAPARPWMPVEAVQYDLRAPVARFFHMRATMSGVLPVLARDTYVGGLGRMVVRVADLVTVIDGSGPEFDQGELVAWLNDCVLLAPSMLLGPNARFTHVDARAFDVAVTDEGNTVTGRVLVDDRGAPIDFETKDRWLSDPVDPRRLLRRRWSTPVESWQTIDGREVVARGSAVWHAPAGDFRYAELDLVPGTLAFDAMLDPGRAFHARAA